jgi:hypothetical protein
MKFKNEKEILSFCSRHDIIVTASTEDSDYIVWTARGGDYIVLYRNIAMAVGPSMEAAVNSFLENVSLWIAREERALARFKEFANSILNDTEFFDPSPATSRLVGEDLENTEQRRTMPDRVSFDY